MYCWDGGAAQTASSEKADGSPVTKVNHFYNGYPHWTKAVRAGQLLRGVGRCDAFEVRQCSEVHTLDQLLHLQEARTA